MFGNGLDKNISLANIYRPPQRNTCNASIEDFLHEFKPVLEIFDKGNSSKIIAGDFNINLLELNDRQKFQEYFDTFVTKGFYPKLTLPTRFSKKRGTLIDQIFCKPSNANQKTCAGIYISNLSDHLPYFFA